MAASKNYNNTPLNQSSGYNVNDTRQYKTTLQRHDSECSTAHTVSIHHVANECARKDKFVSYTPCLALVESQSP